MMTDSHSIVTLVGFDTVVISQLPPRDQRLLRQLSWCLLLPCAAVAGSAAVGAWMLDGSLTVAVPLAICAGLGILNLLRVVIAGGGAAAHRSEAQVKLWAPKLTPLVILGLLAACAAQPLYLTLIGGALDPQIERYRQELIAQHAQGVADLNRSESASSASAPLAGSRQRAFLPAPGDMYREQVQRCQFVTRRLALAWDVPDRPFLFTLMYSLIALIPLLLSHSTHLRTMRAYELERWRQTRQLVRAAERANQREVHEQLAAWPQLSPMAAARVRLRPDIAPTPLTRPEGPFGGIT